MGTEGDRRIECLLFVLECSVKNDVGIHVEIHVFYPISLISISVAFSLFAVTQRDRASERGMSDTLTLNVMAKSAVSVKSHSEVTIIQAQR